MRKSHHQKVAGKKFHQYMKRWAKKSAKILADYIDREILDSILNETDDPSP